MWKKSEIWNNKKCRLLLILEIILLTAGIMGLFSEEGIVADESNMEVQVNGG